MHPQTNQESFRPIAQQAADVMRLLGWYLRSADAQALAKLEPIVFDFFLCQWHVARDVRGFVAEGERAGAALRVSCTPQTLLRLLREPGFSPSRMDLLLRGDASALTPLIDSLKKKTNLLALRASMKSGD